MTIDKEWQKAGMRNANGIPFSPLSSFTVESGVIGAGKETERERERVVQCLQNGKNGAATWYQGVILCKDSRLILAHLEYFMRRVRDKVPLLTS